jgi:hypothetical protein
MNTKVTKWNQDLVYAVEKTPEPSDWWKSMKKFFGF